MSNCPVCHSRMVQYGEALVLGKYEAQYLRCTSCGLIAADKPNWLEEAYAAAITTLDIGLISRTLTLANVTTAILRAEGLTAGTFLDWAGGYGTLTRMMRDRGLDFRHYDPMCVNLFARELEGDVTRHYDLITAVEVLEHLIDPVAELEQAARATNLMLCTTELVPSPPPEPSHWWYFSPETGQHVTFYTAASLRELAGRLGLQALILNPSIHLLYRNSVSLRTRLLLKRLNLAQAVGVWLGARSQKHSLLDADYRAAVLRLQRNQTSHGREPGLQ